MRKGLTPKQARFVEEYLLDLNATQACIRAGYSVKTANVIGPENLAKPCVAAAITAAQEERSKRTEIGQDEIVKGLHTEALDREPGSTQSARVSAWMGLAKIVGLLTDKVVHRDENGPEVHLYLPVKGSVNLNG